MDDDNEKRVKRARFRAWFKTKGLRNHEEFGEWSNYFSKEDERCEEWNLLIYHWNEVRRETKEIVDL